MPEPVAEVLDRARLLADVLGAVVAIGLAGSWARGAGGPDSDVDLVVLTGEPTAADVHGVVLGPGRNC